MQSKGTHKPWGRMPTRFEPGDRVIQIIGIKGAQVELEGIVEAIEDGHVVWRDEAGQERRTMAEWLAYCPTPEEIEAATKEFQERWSQVETKHRTVISNPPPDPFHDCTIGKRRKLKGDL